MNSDVFVDFPYDEHVIVVSNNVKFSERNSAESPDRSVVWCNFTLMITAEVF